MMLLIQYTLVFSSVLLLVALGGCFSERSGIINIGLEGIMVIGALGGVMVLHNLSPQLPGIVILLLTVAASIAAGMIYSLLLAVASINFKADQTLVGTAMNMLGLALATVIAKAYNIATTSGADNSARIAFVENKKALALVEGTEFNWFMVLAFAALAVGWVVLYKTRFGLRLMACGEHPQAADSVGINVKKMRYSGVLISGAVGGLGGIAYVTAGVSMCNFEVGVAGFGFLALAVMIFGQWKPLRIAIAALLFGFFRALANVYSGFDFLTALNIPKPLLSMAGLLVTMLLVHLGTTIRLRDFGAQWRTVIISAVACIAISAAVFFIGQLIIDRGFALVGAPILSGGVVATLTMQDMANKANLPDLAVFATLVMCAQGFVGYPVASLCLKSEAKRIKAQIDAGTLQVDAGAAAAQNAAAARKKLIPALPDKYNTPNAIIAKVILVALLSVWVSSLFHDAINKLVWCLIFGVLCKELGFLDEDALGKAHATGIVMPIITLSIFTNLAAATPEMVGGMVVPLLVCVVIGTAAFSVVSILVGKIFGYSWQMSMAIGSSCLFGFPGTVIISNEVSESTGTTAEEKAAINAQIMPKMLVAGMVTVSITSVLVAGVMSSWL